MFAPINQAFAKLLKATVEGNSVFINNARITVTDIEASNGAIHVIDSVLLPPK
jgi:uncharacterized surface protein with fasciclin (FAS1) repeats